MRCSVSIDLRKHETTGITRSFSVSLDWEKMVDLWQRIESLRGTAGGGEAMADQMAQLKEPIDRLGERYLKASPAERQRLVLDYMRLKEEREAAR